LDGPQFTQALGGNERKDPQPSVENLFLDCGAKNKREVEMLGIHIGAVATYEEGYDELAYDYLSLAGQWTTGLAVL
jgi:putative aminopeptidase FrvX